MQPVWFCTRSCRQFKGTFETHRGGKPNKCNHCDFASVQAGNLRTHLIKHSGVKLHKCNQCDYTSYRKGNMTAHLKTHNWEKLYKCSQCNYASSWAGNLRMHLKTHSAKRSKTDASGVTMPALRHAVWGIIWKPTLEKSQTIATNVIVHPHVETF